MNNPILNKSEVVRVEFVGMEYIHFNELATRITFKEQMAAREEKAAVLRLGMNVLKSLADNISKTGASPFIEANAANIIAAGTKPSVDFEAKYNELMKAIYLAKLTETADGIEIPKANWLKIREKAGLEGSGVEESEHE